MKSNRKKSTLYKEITNNWNYDGSCALTSLLVWNLENFKLFDFCCTECAWWDF
jgi:hypothetical protein